jgi:hypothetical protein
LNRPIVVVLMFTACGGASRLEEDRSWSGAELFDSLGYVVDVEDEPDSSSARILVGSPNLTHDASLDAPNGGAYLLLGDERSGTVDQRADTRFMADDYHFEAFSGYQVAFVGDVSGDGTPDVAISASHTMSGARRSSNVHVFRGPLGSKQAIDQGWWTLFTVGSGNSPAALTSCGDIDGDGFDDLCVGTNPGPESTRSEAAIFYGPLSPGELCYEDAPLIVTAAVDEWAGQHVAGGVDLDGDGLNDFLVGADAREDDAGGVYLVSVPGRGEVQLSSFPLWTGESGAPLGGEAGLGMAVGGDLDGDGRQDAFIAEPLFDQATSRRGRGFVVTEPVGGPLTGAYAVLEGMDDYDVFGFDAAIGDYDGDGQADLAVSAYQDPYFGPSRPGRVAIWLGPVSRGTHDEEDAALVFRGSSRYDGFGRSLDAGDVDGDGAADLVVGAPWDSRELEGAGRVYLYAGASLFDQRSD